MIVATLLMWRGRVGMKWRLTQKFIAVVSDRDNFSRRKKNSVIDAVSAMCVEANNPNKAPGNIFLPSSQHFRVVDESFSVVANRSLLRCRTHNVYTESFYAFDNTVYARFSDMEERHIALTAVDFNKLNGNAVVAVFDNPSMTERSPIHAARKLAEAVQDSVMICVDIDEDVVL